MRPNRFIALFLLLAIALTPLGVAASEPVQVSIRHAYGSGGAGENPAFATVLGVAAGRLPGIELSPEEVPFGDLYSSFAADAASGNPDLLVGPNDALGDQVRAGLVVDVSAAIVGRRLTMRPQALVGATVGGHQYLVPQSLKAVALYYDRTRLPRPPLTTAEWLAAFEGGARLAIIGGGAAYYGYGFYSSFGGRIMDREGRCIADQTGVADALAWQRSALEAGLIILGSGDEGASLLAAGEIDGYIDGNWRFGDLRDALGSRLGVAPGPAGPVGLFRPLVGVDGYVVNAASPDGAAALRTALALTTRSQQRTWARMAGHVPADLLVPIDDWRVGVFALATAVGVPRPQRAEFGAYWGPFSVAFDAVVWDGQDADAAVAWACGEMNAANGF